MLTTRWTKVINESCWLDDDQGINVLPFVAAAAEDLRSNRRAFEQNVRVSMRGGLHKGISYDNVLA